jgi:hypothetical protein
VGGEREGKAALLKGRINGRKDITQRVADSEVRVVWAGGGGLRSRGQRDNVNKLQRVLYAYCHCFAQNAGPYMPYVPLLSTLLTLLRSSVTPSETLVTTRRHTSSDIDLQDSKFYSRQKDIYIYKVIYCDVLSHF